MIASLSGHLPEGSPLPSWTNLREPNFVSTSASHLLPSPICWPFSGQQLRAITKGMATWSLLRSSTSAILSTLKTIPCSFAFRLITKEAFAPIQHLWPQARMWSDLWGWTPCHHHGFIFDVRWKLLDTVLFRLGLESSSNGCVRRQDVISASTVTKDNNSIDYSRIVQKRKNKDETERTSLQFPLYKQRNANLSSQPRLCSFVLTLFESALLAHGFHVGQIETMIANHLELLMKKMRHLKTHLDKV